MVYRYTTLETLRLKSNHWRQSNRTLDARQCVTAGDEERLRQMVLADLERVRDLTDKPVGANLMIQGWKHDPSIVDVLVDAGVSYVATSAGDPGLFTERLKDAGRQEGEPLVGETNQQQGRDKGIWRAGELRRARRAARPAAAARRQRSRGGEPSAQRARGAVPPLPRRERRARAGAGSDGGGGGGGTRGVAAVSRGGARGGAQVARGRVARGGAAAAA